MKKTIESAFFFAAFLGLAAAGIFGFDWPAKNFDPNQSILSFAQNREGAFNTSLVFEDAQGALATDSGKIIAVITEHQNDGDWFESPLGNTLIVSHDDELISIYGNLTLQSAVGLAQKKEVKADEDLGMTGQSSWNENAEDASLEFQISDSNAKTFINPLILMPRALKQKKISMEGISIENQFGRSYPIANLRSVPAGIYKVYKKRQKDATVFKTSVYVNGREVEKITKDTIKVQSGKLFLAGSSNYTKEDFFPNGETEFLGRLFLPHGSNTVQINAQDIYENTSAATYVISGY